MLPFCSAPDTSLNFQKCIPVCFILMKLKLGLLNSDLQGRRHVFWVGGAGLHEKAKNTKRPKVTPPKTKKKKLIGIDFVYVA